MDAVELLERRLRERLVTPAEFDLMLDDLFRLRGSPVVAAWAEFQTTDPVLTVTVGRRGVVDAHATDTAPDEGGLFTVRTELWYAEGAGTEHEVGRDAVRRLTAAWWRGDGRNEKSRLLTGQAPATQRALEESLRQWLLAGRVVLGAADIDNFKRFNDVHGLPAGDALIGRLAAALIRSVPRTSLVVHRSGDEFLMLAPHARPGEVIADAMGIREQIAQVVREGADVEPPPGFSMGIAVCDAPMAYAALEGLAGDALKPGGEKARGRVVVARTTSRPVPDGVDPLQLRLVLAMNLLERAEPFDEAWLDAACVMGSRACAAATDVATLTAQLRATLSQFGEDTAEPPAEVLIAAAHGVVRTLLRGEGPSELSDGVAVHLGEDGVAIVGQGSGALLAGASIPADARVIVVSTDQVSADGIDSRRAVLVTIGDAKLGLPSDLFAATVFVDDRPTIGGGLPDFWEAAISQVIACVSRHPNVDRVVLAGNLEMGRQTVERLRGADRWSDAHEGEKLAIKLELPRSRIAAVGARIAGRVSEVTSASEAVEVMLQDLELAGELLPPSAADPVHEPPRLRRTLSMADMLPGQDYGCRVATASEAFPVALDIVRQIEDGPLEDQTGRLFRELVDFRIQLTQPQQDPVPRFYREDQDLLDGYFNREFISDSGLFRSRLNEQGQMDAVLAHVCRVVATRRLTSRRALLVVPHVPEIGADLSPLGLVSVRVIPRPATPRTVRLDYSFSWRTVEALVGLPYSLFGSIRFAEHITSLVSEQLRPTDPGVSMGGLSYIAHSLHMFVDEYADQVARRIVNDDSL